VAAAAVMRASRRVARVTVAPAAALTSLPREIRDMRACRKDVWQQTPECAVTEMEEWRYGYVLECKTAENVCGS